MLYIGFIIVYFILTPLILLSIIILATEYPDFDKAYIFTSLIIIFMVVLLMYIIYIQNTY
uniref:Uncharacterized protein n=1 Tax=Myoviridae sp. ctXXl13 TaxID=2827691 RepID=A0A8S5TIZ2_9CAUD|nr:MAG TPA: hypothetical protein [Myoviridae sp. ctXXl13]